MRVNQLITSPTEFMLWDKDLGQIATPADVEEFCKIEENVYGVDGECRMQCHGRFKKLAYTGMHDKNKRPIYEAHIVKVSYKIAGQKVSFVGVIGFERASFVIIDTKGNSTQLSAYESEDLKIIGLFFKNPEIMEVRK